MDGSCSDRVDATYDQGRVPMTVQFQRLLHEGLSLTAQRHPEKTAVIVGNETYTYEQLDDCSSRLAKALHDRGLGKGDRAAIYMENGWACVVSIYGILKAGGVFVIINPQTKREKLLWVLHDCAVKILVTETHLAENVEDVRTPDTLISIVASTGRQDDKPGDKHNKRNIDFDEVINESEPLSENHGVIPLDLAALIYTSGSTANPKGVMLTHQSMLFSVLSIIEYLKMTTHDVTLNVLPMSFDYGLYQLLMTVQLGATLILERSFTYHQDILKKMHEHEVTTFPGVPTVFSLMLSVHSKNPLCYPTVKRVTNTAAALNVDSIPRLKEIFPNALIFSMYGLTECKRVSYLEPEMLERKPTSVGKSIPGTETFILDMNGCIAPPGVRGMLHVRGPHVMQGYWNSPEETEKMLVDSVIPGEKMLRTGDWFYCDEEGYLYFDGRSDDIIKCRGEKISPVEIERALCSIPGISEAVVIGVEDEVLGQAVRAYVVEGGGEKLQVRNIKRLLSDKLEGFMIPRDIIITDHLPLNQNRKVCKKDLA